MTTLIPKVDVYEKPEGFLMAFDLPGVEKAAVELRFDRQTLHVTAKRGAGAAGRLRVGSDDEVAYARSLTLPCSIDVAGAEATVKDGVLEVRLPRSEEARPRRIEVS